ncbi:LicD family protein [Methanosphaera sp. ISO3-F5]|uniref:LicD family protein n=1 Tax=Methanosphaera sp. ISO3-F5 TaxID=1452353 RepID=UPI002B25C7B0|nr:LicD family protein [Methanosphaera sp. ISO3-F5]WQH63461.1 LicD family protein [Methanosphaera sp. ISO3-F5]
MLSEELENIRLTMLNTFKNQVNTLFDLYIKNIINFSTLQSRLKILLIAWGQNRLDIKNYGTETNKIEFLEYNQGIRIKQAPWMKNNEGEGYTISSNHGTDNYLIKCINSGKLKLMFRAMDYRDINNKRIPIYVDYIKIQINGEDQLNTHKLSWHNEPVNIVKECDNEQKFHIILQFRTIFDYYPKLKSIFDNIKVKNTLEEHEFINKFLDCEIMLLKYNNQKDSSMELFNYMNENRELFDDNQEILESYEVFSNFLNNYEKYQKMYNQTEYLTQKIEYLEMTINRYERQLDAISSSNNDLFNTIFLDYQLTPNRLYANIKELCTQLLKFMDNICRKHDINWWIDFGNLLGAVRHENFIPWDDDLDIGMMRQDYHHLISVMYDEINEHGLDDCINVYYRYRKLNAKQLNSFAQLFVMDRERAGGNVMAGLDVFPYDYMKEQDTQNIGTRYNTAQRNFYSNLTRGDDRSTVYMGLDYDKVIGTYYEELGLSYEKQPYIIPGVEGAYGYKQNLYEFKIFETDKIFPLSEVQFGKYRFPAPNDVDYYLTNTYGEYMTIPKTIRCHGRVSNFRKIPEINETFEMYVDRFREVNSNF